jgi:hypothetical protein
VSVSRHPTLPVRYVIHIYTTLIGTLGRAGSLETLAYRRRAKRQVQTRGGATLIVCTCSTSGGDTHTPRHQGAMATHTPRCDAFVRRLSPCSVSYRERRKGGAHRHPAEGPGHNVDHAPDCELLDPDPTVRWPCEANSPLPVRYVIRLQRVSCRGRCLRFPQVL